LTLSLRPQPASPLFPYTTLFRSRLVPDEHAHRRGQRQRVIAQPLRSDVEAKDGEETVDQAVARVVDPREDRPRDRHREEVREEEDRKSTRLNSSHQIISYAVFCL